MSYLGGEGFYPAGGIFLYTLKSGDDLTIAYDILAEIEAELLAQGLPLAIFGPNSYENMLPAVNGTHDENQDYALLYYLVGAGQMFDEIENIVRDSDLGMGWSPLVDVNRCPDKGLDWFGQFVGVKLPQGLTEDQRRQRIKSTDGWKRGTPAAIKAAPVPYLTGNGTVILYERDTSAYHFQVLTYTSETPSDDWAVNNIIVNPDFESNVGGWNTNPV